MRGGGGILIVYSDGGESMCSSVCVINQPISVCNSACLFTLFWMNALVYEFVHSFLLFGAFTDVLLTIWCCSVSEHA